MKARKKVSGSFELLLLIVYLLTGICEYFASHWDPVQMRFWPLNPAFFMTEFETSLVNSFLCSSGPVAIRHLKCSQLKHSFTHFLVVTTSVPNLICCSCLFPIFCFSFSAMK